MHSEKPVRKSKTERIFPKLQVDQKVMQVDFAVSEDDFE